MNLLTRFKFCPGCASPALSQPDAKHVHCGQCGFTYYHNVAAAAAAIIEYEGKILLTRRAHDPLAGGWDLPGGFIDYQETAEAGLIREVREELNIEIGNLRYLTTTTNLYMYREMPYDTLDIFFVCRPLSLEGIGAKDDVAGYEFFTPSAIPLEGLAFEATRRGLRYYLRENGY